MQGELVLKFLVLVSITGVIIFSFSPTQRFQDVEEAHLKQMKEFIMLYIEIVQNNHDLVGQVSVKRKQKRRNTLLLSVSFLTMFRQQVQSDFKRQFLDLTVDKLLEQFVLNKYTGLEKPGMLNKI